MSGFYSSSTNAAFEAHILSLDSQVIVRLELIPRAIEIGKHRRTNHLLLRGRALRDLCNHH